MNRTYAVLGTKANVKNRKENTETSRTNVTKLLKQVAHYRCIARWHPLLIGTEPAFNAHRMRDISLARTYLATRETVYQE